MAKKKREYKDWELPYWEEELKKVEWLKQVIENPAKHTLLSTHRDRKKRLAELSTPLLATYVRAKKIVEKGCKLVLTSGGYAGYMVGDGEIYLGISEFPSSSFVAKNVTEITPAEFVRKMMHMTAETSDDV